MSLLVRIIVSIFLGFILTFVGYSHVSVHPYIFGSECNESNRLNGEGVACYGVTEIYGYPLGYQPKIPGSLGSGFEDMNRLFLLDNFILDVLFFSLISYVAWGVVRKATNLAFHPCDSGKKNKKCHRD